MKSLYDYYVIICASYCQDYLCVIYNYKEMEIRPKILQGGRIMANFGIRISDKTHQKIKFIAKQQDRSLNKQIEYVLKQFINNYEQVNGKIETKEEE